MPKITALQQTKLKKSAVDSMRLRPEEIAPVAQGQELRVISCDPPMNNHRKITFSGTLTIGGQRWADAYIYDPTDQEHRHWDGLQAFDAAAIAASNLYSPKGSADFIIPVPYQCQIGNDESLFGPDWRQCFLTSVSGAVRALLGEAEVARQVQAAGASEWESVYAQKLAQFGDTTESSAQVATLRSMGFDADFRTNGNLEELREILKRGVPVPIGVAWHIDGHWVMVVGFGLDGSFIVNDPNGRRRLGSGGLADGIDDYESIGSGGEHNRYSEDVMRRIWMDTGANTGWLVEIKGRPAVASNPPASAGSPHHYKPQEFRANSIAAKLIGHFEGLRLSQYYCSSGVSSIGLGTTRWHDGGPIPVGATITEDQAIAFFKRDSFEFIGDIQRLVNVPLTARQIAVLLSFAYNCGTGEDGLGGSTLLKVINRSGSDSEVRSELRKWINSAGQPSDGLRRRRNAEVMLWQGRDDWESAGYE
jgi:lysozyme